MNVFTDHFPRRWALVAKAPLLLLSILATVASCQREATPACGCEGPTHSVFTDEPAVYKQGLIYPLDRSKYFFSLSCNSDFVKGKVADGDTIVFSGRTHSDCFKLKIETLIALPGMLEVTAIRKQ